jgi:glycosyltransferase involved in cell wall biosynthesis
MRALFAVPGDLGAPTGGYAYARALLAHAPAGGLDLRHLPLPGSYPFPTAADLAATAAALAAADAPLLIDGLAFGAMPAEIVAAARVPVVALIHHPLGHETGLDPDVAARLLASERQALAAAAHVVTVSPAMRATLVRDFAVPDDRITLAPPGLARAPAAARAAGTPPVILSVGSLTPRKGHDVLIRALARIASAPWTCRIAGTEARGSGWGEQLRHQAARAGLVGRVQFLGQLDAAQLNQTYLESYLFCLPSRYEGYGMVFAEAMMRGLPIVACRVPAVDETVPGAAGMLAPADDDAAIADFLAILLTQRAVADRMAAAGRAHALGLPDWPDTAALVASALARAAA